MIWNHFSSYVRDISDHIDRHFITSLYQDQGGRGHWTENYTGIQSFITTVSYSLVNNFGYFIEFKSIGSKLLVSKFSTPVILIFRKIFLYSIILGVYLPLNIPYVGQIKPLFLTLDICKKVEWRGTVANHSSFYRYCMQIFLPIYLIGAGFSFDFK